MANIREVAKKAGVSVATVSRVLNHPETVSEATKQKVLNTMRDMNYTPNAIARSLALNKTSTIALLLPTILNPLYPEAAKGIEEVAYQKGYNILLCSTEDDVEKEREYIDVLLNKKVDGFIFISTSLQDEDFNRIKEYDIPFVIIGGKDNYLDINMVFTDYAEGAYLATQHLLELGYQRIAHIAGPFKKIENLQKIDGYKKAMTCYERELDEKLIVEGNNDIEGGYLAAKKLLRSKNRPDAIFAGNDLMAMGAMDAIKDMGLKIPDDIAVVGFDDIKMASLIDPKLTTMAQPIYKMGTIAIRLLLDNIERVDEEAFSQKIFLQPKLKVRKSCGHAGRIREIFN